MIVKPLRYGLFYLGTSLVLMIVSWLMARAFGAGVPFGALAILPPIIGALAEGMRIGKETGEIAPNGPAWTGAAILTLITVTINAVLLWPFLRSPALRSGEVDIAPLIWLAVSSVAVVFFVIRLFLFFGSRNAVLAQQGRK